MKYAVLALAVVLASVIAAAAEQLNCNGIIIEPGLQNSQLQLTSILNWPNSKRGRFDLVWKPNRYGTLEIWLNGKRCEVPE